MTALSSASSPRPPEDRDGELARLLTEGRLAARTGRMGEAHRALGHVRLQVEALPDPRLWRLRLDLAAAVLRYFEGDVEASTQDLEQLAEQARSMGWTADEADAHSLVALGMLQQGRLGAAVTRARAALALVPAEAAAVPDPGVRTRSLLVVSHALQEAGESEPAYAWWRRTLESALAESDPVGLCAVFSRMALVQAGDEMLRVLLGQGDTERLRQALVGLSTVISMRQHRGVPQVPLDHVFSGMLLRRLGETEAGQAAMLEWCKQVPPEPSVLLLRRIDSEVALCRLAVHDAAGAQALGLSAMPALVTPVDLGADGRPDVEMLLHKACLCDNLAQLWQSLGDARAYAARQAAQEALEQHQAHRAQVRAELAGLFPHGLDPAP